MVSHGNLLDSQGKIRYEDVINQLAYMPPDTESVVGRGIRAEGSHGTWHLKDCMPVLKSSRNPLYQKLDELTNVYSSVEKLNLKQPLRLNAKTVLLSK